jgi:uncharacterized membrane protein (UPF0182 family)
MLVTIITQVSGFVMLHNQSATQPSVTALQRASGGHELVVALQSLRVAVQDLQRSAARHEATAADIALQLETSLGSANEPTQSPTNASNPATVNPWARQTDLENSLAVVDNSISRGVWTSDDVNALATTTENLTYEDYVQILEKLGDAINAQQLKLEAPLL